MNRQRIWQALIFLTGLLNTFSGAALLLAPAWFYETIAKFPPFNRHFLGDTGSFLFPLGLGLLIAARDPARYASLIGVAALANAIHALNHIYDSITQPAPEQLFFNTVPLIIFALALSWVWWDARKKQSENSRHLYFHF